MTKEEKAQQIEYLVRKALHGKNSISIEGVRIALRFGVMSFSEDERETIINKVISEGLLEE